MAPSTKKLLILCALVCMNIFLLHFTIDSTPLLLESYDLPNIESPSFSVDILSVASINANRTKLVDAQKRTFASHSSVRNFFNATEVDDYDPTCYKDLTWQHVAKISNFCRNTLLVSGISSELRYLRHNFAREQWLAKKANPVGWMCAQPRPFSGLRKAYLHYKENRQPLPDYFIIMDDDTYYNMETFQQIHEKLNSTEPTVVAGCLVRNSIHQINFTFPFGGFGAVFSKGSLQYIFHPIYCPNVKNGTVPMNYANHANAEGICNQLSKNIFGELRHFENGDSLLDLIYKYVSTDRYRDVAKWGWKNMVGGFCMHSDWVTGFLVNFYNVSKHVEEKYYEDVPQARMESFNGSEIYARPSGYCKNDGKCMTGAMICHKPSVEWVENEVAKWNKTIREDTK